MDAAALPVSPLPTSYDAPNGAASRQADDGEFSQHLEAQAGEKSAARRVDDRRASDDKDDDDKSKPDASVSPPAFALSAPVAPVIVRTDGAQPTQTVLLDAVGSVGAGRQGEASALSNNAPAATAEAGDVVADAAGGSKQADGRKDAKAARASGVPAVPVDDKSSDAFAKLAKTEKAQDAAQQPLRAQAGPEKSSLLAPRDAAKNADAHTPGPAPAEAPLLSTDVRRVSEAQPSVVHRPPTIAATVAQNVIRRFNGDSTSIDLQLHPAELGKVHVKLDVGSDSRVTAIVAADNPATLSDLMRSSRELQHALESAGLELASGGLSFDLSQNNPDARNGASSAAAQEAGASSSEAAGDQKTSAATAAQRPFGLETWRGVRVDMTV